MINASCSGIMRKNFEKKYPEPNDIDIHLVNIKNESNTLKNNVNIIKFNNINIIFKCITFIFNIY